MQERFEILANAVVALNNWYGITKNANDCFEENAAVFEKETGYLAPGKSVPPSMGYESLEAERKAAHKAWIEKKQRQIRDRVEEALKAIAEQEQQNQLDTQSIALSDLH